MDLELFVCSICVSIFMFHLHTSPLAPTVPQRPTFSICKVEWEAKAEGRTELLFLGTRTNQLEKTPKTQFLVHKHSINLTFASKREPRSWQAVPLSHWGLLVGSFILHSWHYTKPSFENPQKVPLILPTVTTVYTLTPTQYIPKLRRIHQLVTPTVRIPGTSGRATVLRS